MRAFLNPAVRRDDEYRGLFASGEYRDVRAFFERQPGSPGPLRSLPSIALSLGVAGVDAKDETSRDGVNAFKICGVRYAVHRLAPEIAAGGVVCATAGNHGRAVARVAREHGVRCTVFVPTTKTSDPIEHATRAARIASMQDDDARVIDVDGTYEEAVRQAAAFGESTGAVVVSDTSWTGYERIPRWIMAGYTQVLEEASRQWHAPPTLVVVQAGVGGLVCAAASWFAARYGKARPFFVAAEPEQAACLLASAQAGRATTIDSSLETIMAGLRCAEPSPIAWPAIAAGVDAFVTVADTETSEAMRTLAAQQIHTGPSGACGLAALSRLVASADVHEVRSAARLDSSTQALVILTEGR